MQFKLEYGSSYKLALTWDPETITTLATHPGLSRSAYRSGEGVLLNVPVFMVDKLRFQVRDSAALVILS